MQTICEVFAQLIYVHGFVHCDPHPGNIMVRRLSTGRHQVVLIDHGLYRKFDENFRVNFCGLFKAMVLQDQALLSKKAVALGIPDESASLLSILFVHRAMNCTVKLGERMNVSECMFVIQCLYYFWSKYCLRLIQSCVFNVTVGN